MNNDWGGNKRRKYSKSTIPAGQPKLKPCAKQDKLIKQHYNKKTLGNIKIYFAKVQESYKKKKISSETKTECEIGPLEKG